jgi:DNA primase
LQLEKAGAQFKAKCPFHGERTPSFYISPARNNYHCFGCGEHGDIFSFIIKIEGVPFKEALKMLADKAGVTLQNRQQESNSTIYDIMDLACKFFQSNLYMSKTAEEYILKRGLNKETLVKWQVGFAQNDWRSLYKLYR